MPDKQDMVIGGLLMSGVLIYAAISDSSVWQTLTGGSNSIDYSSGFSDGGSDDSSATDGSENNSSAAGPGIDPSQIPGIRGKVVAAARGALTIKSGYLEARPMPSSLQAAETEPTDCSGFATLCYKAAGAPDPNGLGYNGYGYTGSLIAHGRKTNNPQPADLHFWQNPDHVAVDVGNGDIIEWGGPPGPVSNSVTAESANHAAYLGARTYL